MPPPLLGPAVDPLAAGKGKRGGAGRAVVVVLGAGASDDGRQVGVRVPVGALERCEELHGGWERGGWAVGD